MSYARVGAQRLPAESSGGNDPREADGWQNENQVRAQIY